jgi:hypothetical protein
MDFNHFATSNWGSKSNTQFDSSRNIYSNSSNDKVNKIHNKKIRDKILERDNFDSKHNKSRSIRTRPKKRNKIYKSSYSDSDYSDSDYSDDRSINSEPVIEDIHGSINKSYHQNELDLSTSITNNRKFENCVTKQSKFPRNKFNEKNTWVHQLDPMRMNNNSDFVASNAIPNVSGNNSNMKRLELERQLEMNEGFSNFDENEDGTYGIVDPNSKQFSHENQQPFVRRGPSAYQEQARADANDRRLQLFSGSSNQIDYRPKVERAPLFSTLVGAKNIYGDPVRTDEFKSRYGMALTREKRNEKPFQDIKVTPGLGIGYNSVGKHGFHDQYNYSSMYKTVDELRTLNNPKISYGSYVGPGKKGDKGPIQGRVVQYKPDTFRERGTKDMVRSKSYINGMKVRDNYDPKNIATINRGTKENIKMGHAKFNIDKNTPGKFRGNHRESRRENYKNDHPRNIHQYESFKGQGHNNDAYIPDKTQREQGSRVGTVYNSNMQKENYINYNNTPDPTKRNIHNQYDRTGNVQGNKQQYIAINYNDTPDPTKRTIHNKYDRTGNVQGNKQQYIAINYDDTPDSTKRNIHNKYDRTGNIQGNKKGHITINWNDLPDITKRQIHNELDRAGNPIGNKKGHVTINWNDLPDITKRQIHNKYDRTGNIQGNKQQYVAINYDDIPDITKRQIHNQYDRTGNIQGNRRGHIAINWNDLPDITKRQIHNELDRAGNPIGNKKGHITINWNDLPDITKRQIHNKYDRTGNVQGNKQQYVAINYDDLPDLTKRNIHNQYDRSGNVQGNKQQYIAINFNDMPDPTKRDIHNKYDRTGNVKGNKQQYQAIDYDDVPDITKRSIHNKYDRAGNVKGNKQQYQVIDYDDVPDITKRSIHNKYDRAGNVQGNRQQYKAIDYDDVPDITKRAIHNKGRVGTAKHDIDKQGSRHAMYNMRMNSAKEALEVNRQPTKIGMNKGYTIDHTAFELKELPNATWRPSAGSTLSYHTDQLGITNTKVPTNKYYINDRILSHINENLEGNPFVNNLLHKSINL